jgi:DNA-binding phage protein
MILQKERNTKTSILNEKLNEDISFTQFFDENEKSFLDIPLSRYLKSLIEKRGYSKARVIRDSGINRRFFFDILSNKRNPTRNYVLRILIALHIPLKNMQWLLRATGYAQLYARDKRDSVIIYCINHKTSVDECNIMLQKISLEQI